MIKVPILFTPSDYVDFNAPYTPPTDEEYCESVHNVLRVYKECKLDQALLLVPPHRREAVRKLVMGSR